MKAHALAGAFFLFTAPVGAQVGELYNAEVTENSMINDPAIAIEQTTDGWIAFSLPALAGTRSPCCWKGKWSGLGEVGCSLEVKHRSYGTSSESPVAENIFVFAQTSPTGINALQVIGEQCPMDAQGARVNWIGEIDELPGLNWLEAVAMANSGYHDAVGDSALYALAMHHSDEVSRRLYAMAKKQQDEISEEAIFWLGEARAEEGFRYLKKLLVELPEGDTRHEINFALSLNGSPGAAETLIEIARSDNDPEQRGDALFWLTDQFPDQAKDVLLERLEREQDEEVLGEVIFAISELPGNTGAQILLAIARDKKKDREVRREALFWLANSGNEEGVNDLVELLTQEK